MNKKAFRGCFWFVIIFVIFSYFVGQCTLELVGQTAESCVKQTQLSKWDNLIIVGTVALFCIILYSWWVKDTGGFTYWKDKKEREENNG